MKHHILVLLKTNQDQNSYKLFYVLWNHLLLPGLKKPATDFKRIVPLFVVPPFFFRSFCELLASLGPNAGVAVTRPEHHGGVVDSDTLNTMSSRRDNSSLKSIPTY